MLLYSIVSIGKDSRTEMQAWGRGTELLPKLAGVEGGGGSHRLPSKEGSLCP